MVRSGGIEIPLFFLVAGLVMGYGGPSTTAKSMKPLDVCANQSDAHPIADDQPLEPHASLFPQPKGGPRRASQATLDGNMATRTGSSTVR